MSRWIALTLLTLLAVPARAEYASRNDVEAAARSAAIEAKRHADADTLTAALQQAHVRSTIEPLAAEARMQQLLLRLREAAVSTHSARETVQALLTYSPRVFTDAIDPEQRKLQVPAFAIDGTARATLHRWERAAAIAAYRKALAGADLETLRHASDAGALVALIEQANVFELSLLRAADPSAPAAHHALFRRLHDPQLALSLLRTPDDPQVPMLIEAIPALLSPQDALSVLSHPAISPAYRSATRMATGALLPDLAAREHLLSTLDDAHGAASAAALARHLDADILSALQQQLSSRDDSLKTRRALLSLRLSEDARAVEVLQAYADDAQQPPSLRDQVHAWLQP